MTWDRRDIPSEGVNLLYYLCHIVREATVELRRPCDNVAANLLGPVATTLSVITLLTNYKSIRTGSSRRRIADTSGIIDIGVARPSGNLLPDSADSVTN